VDALGRVVETKSISGSQVVEIGQLYYPGIYIVRVSHGKDYRQLKLVKLGD
jgi:hypothetical protein